MIGALIPSVPVVQMAKVNSLPKRLRMVFKTPSARLN